MMWPTADPLSSPRFLLEPITEHSAAGHAAEMTPVLAPPELYAFTGGTAPGEQELRARFARQGRGHSPAGDAGWLNWIIRSREDRAAIGYVQATLSGDPAQPEVEIAWLVSPSRQGAGVATEAAAAVLEWLRGAAPRSIRAHIHPEHTASRRVAERLGLRPTGRAHEGEDEWEEPGEAARPGDSAPPVAPTR